MQASFTRREKALNGLGQLKATMFAMYLMFETWDKDEKHTFACEVPLTPACLHPPPRLSVPASPYPPMHIPPP